MDEATGSERPPSGPFDRILRPEGGPQGDRTATVLVAAIIILGVILLVLVLPPVSILSDGGQAAVSSPVTAVARSELPALPPGVEALSPLYDLSAPEPVDRNARPVVTVLLHGPQAESQGLALYTFDDGDWRRLAQAELTDEGRAAKAELKVLPPNVAALRQTARARLVFGALGAGAELDPKARELLTTLNPGGVTPTADGRLAGQVAGLPPDLATPIAPIISALGPAEIDSVNAVLASPDVTAAHVQELLGFVRNGNYAGLNLDYRAVDPDFGAAFTQFVQQLSQGLHAEGGTLMLTLPLPVEGDGQWNTFGYDWRALAPLVDNFKLPIEPNQDVYYERMERVLPFLTAQVGGSKLVLEVTPLSHEQSVDGIRALTLTDALTAASLPVAQVPGPVGPGATATLLGQNLAEQTNSSGLYWEDKSRSVLFSYPGLGGYRTVWLANAFSEAFRIDLARRFGLAGVAVEDVATHASGASSIWPAVQQYAESGEIDLAKPNDDVLAPTWEATGGSIAEPSGAAVTWQAPAEPGTYDVTFIVSDGVVRAGQELPVIVAAPVAAPPP